MKKKWLAVLLLGAGSLLAQVSFGVRIGPPPPPRVIRVQPPSPGQGYTFVNGYWYPVGNRYRWHDGYWTRPPYNGARWVSPDHDGTQFHQGYWDGDNGRYEHDHHSDRGHDRDYRH